MMTDAGITAHVYKRVRAKKIVFIACASLNLFLFLILFTPLLRYLVLPLYVTDSPGPADVIVVLSAGSYISGMPDHQTMTRLRQGIELYRKKFAPKIICSGGTPGDSTGCSVAKIMKDSLVMYGVPQEDILVQDNTINTFRDITGVLAEYSDRFSFDRALFVTSAYHSFRVRKILDHKGLHQARIVAADPWELYPQVWTERMEICRAVFREYGALCYFKLRGWL